MYFISFHLLQQQKTNVRSKINDVKLKNNLCSDASC